MILLSAHWSPCYGNIEKAGDSYIVSAADLRDIVAGWQSEKDANAVLRAGVDELRAEINRQSAEMADLTADLERQIRAERRRSSRLDRRRLLVGIVIGTIIGVAVTR